MPSPQVSEVVGVVLAVLLILVPEVDTRLQVSGKGSPVLGFSERRTRAHAWANFQAAA